MALCDEVSQQILGFAVAEFHPTLHRPLQERTETHGRQPHHLSNIITVIARVQ